MKKLVYLIAAVILLSVSCKPDRDCCIVANPSSGLSAEKNGAAWKPQFLLGSLGINTFSISASSLVIKGDSAIKADSLHIQVPDIQSVEINKLQSSQVFYATYSGNVPTVYKLDTTFNNTLNITSYQVLVNNATTNPNLVEVKGTFNLKFIDPANPAGISISASSFFTTMSQ